MGKHKKAYGDNGQCLITKKHVFYKYIMFYCVVVLVEVVIIVILHNIVVCIADKHSKTIKENLIIHNYIINDMKYFPIPIKYRNEVNFEDTYGAYRDNGGHEGCDIMDNNNVSGKIPIISSTNGVITNMGWLYLGGNRIGITSDNGVYYYYAHLASYASNIKAGDKVIAGQFIGFMGDTGEGDEGTSGKFPVHLHFGIYTGMDKGHEKAVDPYKYLLNVY